MFETFWHVFKLFPSKKWVSVVTCIYIVWVLCVLSIVPNALNGLVILSAIYLWLLEMTAYAKCSGVKLNLATATRSGWRYSSFRICFWHPQLVIVKDESNGYYIPILRDSMSAGDYYRFLQLTWSIKNRHLLIARQKSSN